MAKREDLGSSWPEIVDKWYLGSIPPVPADEAWDALGLVESLLPERIDRVLAGGSRGAIAIAPLVDLGRNLSKCLGLPGFLPVLARIRAGERSAEDEVLAVATFSQLGYEPSFEPHVPGGKRADALLTVDGARVFVEVAAPEQSAPFSGFVAQLRKIAHTLREGLADYKYEVFLLTDPDDTLADAILGHVKIEVPHSLAAPIEVPGIAIVRASPLSLSSSLETVQGWNPDGLPAIGVISFGFRSSADSEVAQPVGATVEVRSVFLDSRAKRFLSREGRHFSSSEINLLALNVSAVSGRRRGWADLIQRQFQPKMYTRISGVVLFEGYIGDAVQEWRWTTLTNPYAANKLTQRLLKDLSRLPSEM